MKDYYSILGVPRGASTEEIKQAYRRAAMRHHPDRGGDEGKFKEIEEAYRVLSDTQQRQAYDNPGAQFNFGGGDASGFNFDEIFRMFGTRFNDFGAQQRQPGYARMNLWISLADVARGGARIVTVGTPMGQSNVEIEIPPGVDDGANVRYTGLAPGGLDLVVQFRVHPDARWQRHGSDLSTDYQLNVWDLILGTEFELDTITGSRVRVRVPEVTQPNTVLRVRGYGLPTPAGSTGDALVRVQARIPRDIPPTLLEEIRRARTH